jgi:hypothetical protein
MQVAESLDGAVGAPTESFIRSKTGQHSQMITAAMCTIDGSERPPATRAAESWLSVAAGA